MIRRRWVRLGRSIGGIFRRNGFWWIVLVAVTVAAGVGLSWHFWEALRGNEDSLSTTISNVSLVLGGVVAIELAVWRSIVGERQTDAAQRQAETAQSGLLNERFQEGAEMLGSENLSVRLGGIYTLKHLAAEHPEQYHVQVMELLCAFVRHPTKELSGDADGNEKEQSPRADVSAIAEIIRNRTDAHIQVERKAEFRLDLRYADLRRLHLDESDLSDAFLCGADLSWALLRRANLSNAQLQGAVFSELGSGIKGKSYQEKVLAKASFARLRDANISGALFSSKRVNPALGLTQEYVDEACADPKNEPSFEGVVDSETRKPIVWQGTSCEIA